MPNLKNAKAWTGYGYHQTSVQCIIQSSCIIIIIIKEKIKVT